MINRDNITLPRSVVEQALAALFMYKSIITGVTFQHGLDAIQELRAALEQPQDHPEQHLNMVPPGWNLVPVEPTRDMLVPWIKAPVVSNTLARSKYLAMLAAAPQLPVVKDSSTTHQAQPKRDPLSDEQILKLGWAVTPYANQMEMLSIARAIERAHGIKGEA